MTDKPQNTVFEEFHRRVIATGDGAPAELPESPFSGNATARVQAQVDNLNSRLTSLETRVAYIADVCAAFLKNAGHLATPQPDPLQQALGALPEHTD